MAKDQPINSLDRFRKQSSRLILEQYSNCEVPAGCGGVVLRWRNPLTARPLVLGAYTPVDAAFAVDGRELQTGRVDLAPGRHVLTLFLKDVELSHGLVMLAGIDSTYMHGKPVAPEAADKPFRLVTAADGSWKSATNQPVESWTTLDFDDSQWPALVEVANERLAIVEARSRRAEWCRRDGAVCLGMPEPTSGVGSLWVRKVFEVPAAEPPAS